MFLNCSLLGTSIQILPYKEHSRIDVPYLIVPYFGLVRAMFLNYFLRSSRIRVQIPSHSVRMGFLKVSSCQKAQKDVATRRVLDSLLVSVSSHAERYTGASSGENLR